MIANDKVWLDVLNKSIDIEYNDKIRPIKRKSNGQILENTHGKMIKNYIKVNKYISELENLIKKIEKSPGLKSEKETANSPKEESLLNATVIGDNLKWAIETKKQLELFLKTNFNSKSLTTIDEKSLAAMAETYNDSSCDKVIKEAILDLKRTYRVLHNLA